MAQKLLVTNFAYGTGPYLRTTELAVAFNDELEGRGYPRMPVIVPLVYGDKQVRIMLEEFGEHIKKHPGELLLDRALGAILKTVFYTGKEPYATTLTQWVASVEDVSRQANAHLSGMIEVETFAGEKSTLDGRDIVLELNRSPRIRYGVAPSFSTTFGYIAEILENALSVGRDIVDVDPELLRQGIKVADSIEGSQTLNAMAYPATFSWREDYKPRYPGEILVPPITDLPKDRPQETMEQGIYVTITGIEGLERLYQEARELGLKLYSNDTEAVPGSVKALPHVIPNPAIQFQFARSGWGSVWLSMFVGRPIVVPQFDKTDDPEIYFNNIAVEQTGIGIIYRGQPLADILKERERVKANCAAMRKRITARFGTLDGNRVCAKLFADHFLK